MNAESASPSPPPPTAPLTSDSAAEAGLSSSAFSSQPQALLTRCRSWVHETLIPWTQGPDPPVDVALIPILPRLQAWPSYVLQKHMKRKRIRALALGTFLLLWIVLFGIVIHYSRFADRVEGVVPEHLSCTSTFWYKNNQCGMDGVYCRPFDGRTIAFRCPANCLQSGQVLNPRAVGDTVFSHRPLVVGGPDPAKPANITYRADSFICPAAIHAGIVSNRYGGCGIITQTGKATNFASSRRNGVTSLPFPATFPSSYSFVPESEYHASSCRDLRWHLFAVSIPFTTLAIILLPGLPGTVFASLFTGIFFHVALASDPPFLSNPSELVSRALSRFLPAAFVAAVIWKHVFKPVYRHPIFTSGSAVMEKAIFFLGGLWIGALNNLTFDVIIPIDRLTSRDLNEQRGAKAALAIIIVILFVCVVLQAYYIRLSGQLPQMLGLYALFGIGLGLLAAIPGNSLRIHHYILALLLLPGTRLPTRPSLLFQGILLGLFINGVARWGFAGIVETPTSLQGDGLYYSPIPKFEPPPVVGPTNVTIFWNTTALAGTAVEGISLLVNDVERGRGQLEWGEAVIERIPDEPLYLRMAYSTDILDGKVWDYTRAGVVEPDGNWRAPENGRS